MPNYADPFREIEKITLEGAIKAQDLGLYELESEPTRPNIGMDCFTNGGTQYLWGPVFLERINQWQDFILKTRGKSTASVFHYGSVNETDPRSWTNWTDLYVAAFPLQDNFANWILKHIADSNEDHGIVMSGMLLADLIDWVRKNNATLKGNCIFTTFEPFPRKKIPMLFEHFDDWCDYSRSWDGGLSYYRCIHGTYHTFDHITILKESIDDNTTSHAIDLLNKAQKFINHPTGEIIKALSLEKSKICKCEIWHRDFELLGRDSWVFEKQDGSETLPNLVSMSDVDNEYQIIQYQPGHLVALRPNGWDGFEKTNLLEKLENEGFSISMVEGHYRRRGKRPFIFNERKRRGRKGIIGGFEVFEPQSFTPLSV